MRRPFKEPFSYRKSSFFIKKYMKGKKICQLSHAFWNYIQDFVIHGTKELRSPFSERVNRVKQILF